MSRRRWRWLAAWGLGLGCGPSGEAADAATAATRPTCAATCALWATTCGRIGPGPGGHAACLAACARVPSAGALGDLAGDTVGCRLTYLLLGPKTPARTCPLASFEHSPACRDAAPEHALRWLAPVPPAGLG